MNDLKKKLIQMAGDANNNDLKMAIAAQPETVKKGQAWVENEFFVQLSRSFGRTDMAVKALVEDGLSFGGGDFYVYAGRGGIKVHETPKGVRKQMQRVAAKHGLNIVVYDGVLYENDRLEVKSDGRIDEILITKDQQTLTNGGTIIAPYAVVTVFRNGGEVIAKKIFVIPQNEYAAILQAGSGSSYPTMMAQKSVLKRVAAGIYSLLGVSLGGETDLDDIEDRLEDEPRKNSDAPKHQPDPLDAEVVDAEAQRANHTEVNLDEV